MNELLKKMEGHRPGRELEVFLSYQQQLIGRIMKIFNERSQFAFQMAHEMKTPLTILKNYLQSAALNPENAWRDYQAAHAEIDALRSFMQRPFDGKERVHLVIKKDIIPRPFDEELFSQLVDNLMMNALKYSDFQSKVENELSSHSLSVRDQGPGIPQDVWDKRGEMFNRSNDHAGSGLGLAWVLLICQWHHWTLHKH